MLPTLNVRALAAKDPEGQISFSFVPEDGLLDLPLVSLTGEVQADLHYEIAEDLKVYLTGELRFTLEGSCSRCLAPAKKDFTAAVEGVFEEGGGDGETYGYHGGAVRLEEFLRDSLLFAFPSVLLCTECSAQDD